MLWKVALELLLRTALCSLVKDGKAVINFKSQYQAVFLILKKRWYREANSIRPFMTNGVFCFFKSIRSCERNEYKNGKQ